MSAASDALAAIGGLSAPGKMPCHSWSIPAQTCQLGSLLAAIKESTCFGCYALKGLYVMPCTVHAMERRYDVLGDALASAEGGRAFVAAFALVLNAKAASTRKRIERGQKVAKDGRYFRWHDSGDLQGSAHLALYADIARACPTVDFWLPTREAGHVAKWLRDFVLPSNLTVRISTPLKDRAPSRGVVGGAGIAYSGVHTSAAKLETMGAESCIAYDQEGECRDCRRCWDTGRQHISYPLH